MIGWGGVSRWLGRREGDLCFGSLHKEGVIVRPVLHTYVATIFGGWERLQQQEQRIYVIKRGPLLLRLLRTYMIETKMSDDQLV